MPTLRGSYVAISRMLQKRFGSSTELIHGSQDHNWLDKMIWSIAGSYLAILVRVATEYSEIRQLHRIHTSNQ